MFTGTGTNRSQRYVLKLRSSSSQITRTFVEVQTVPTLSKRLSLTILVSIVVLSVLLWFHLARQMPLRYFVSFCLLLAAFMGLEFLISKSFAEGLKRKRHLKVLLELALGILFVTVFYLFAAHVYPGVR
jgi:hypothetical protein